MSIVEFDAMAQKVLDPRRFTVVPSLQLRVERVDEEVFWELFHGRALDHTMTRRMQKFHSWNIFVCAADEPLLSIKFDVGGQTAHVTRSILCHVHSAVSVNENTIESAPATRWLRELVGTAPADARLFDELITLMFQAVVGTSRLPLTSLESPLPAFTLGQLGYFPDGADAEVEAKRLEFALRSGTKVDHVNNALQTLRRTYHGLSLSPYTNFVTKVLRYLRTLETDGTITPAQRAGFLSYLLRLQWRHLNAYDLLEFHHRGANYPDALLIDEVMAELLSVAAETPEVFEDSLVRRGLRLGWLLRTIYRGHPVPSQPTSPGETMRILPDSFVRVDAAEIEHSHLRSRRLFEHEIPLSGAVKKVLSRCLDELCQSAELRELGTALFADRPLGINKSPLEPDQTPMFSHLAFSRQRAAKVLHRIRSNADDMLRPFLDLDPCSIHVTGVPIPVTKRPARPGVISLQDAYLVADDFVILATTQSSIEAFRACFSWSGFPPEWLAKDRWHIVLPDITQSDPQLLVYNRAGKCWLSLKFGSNRALVRRSGVELPAGGLKAVELASGREIDVNCAERR